MSEAVIAAIITGICAVLSQLLISRSSNKDILAKMHEETMANEAKIEKRQAITDTKLDNLASEVREHNNFAKRVPVLEEKVANLERKVG
jgi:hypothetical protein